ncbi:MAG TPA: DUF3592 domain-containing protein [Flavobacteriales bacterium]|jgi:hypothetical protein
MEFFSENQEILIYVGAAIAVLVIGYFQFKNEIAFMFSKKETEGTITNWMSATQEGKRYYYPMISYTPEGHETITFRAEERSEGSPMYEPGTKVIVQYLEKKPTIRKVIYPAKP